MTHLKLFSDQKVSLRQFIKNKYPHIKYSRLQQSIRKGDLLVNGKRVPPQTILEPGDTCSIWDKLIMHSPDPIPKGLKCSVIAKNEDFWVFDKPYGIATQGGTGINYSMIDIASSMMERPAYCVHRLDRYTTGLLIMACNSYAARDLSQTLKNKEWEKIYIAKISPGNYPSQGIINEPVNTKQALTRYKILERKEEYSLVCFTPITGRMHQIRFHSAIALRPLLGDKKFGSEVNLKIFLRCIKLQIAFRGLKMVFHA